MVAVVALSNASPALVALVALLLIDDIVGLHATGTRADVHWHGAGGNVLFPIAGAVPNFDSFIKLTSGRSYMYVDYL